MDLRRARAALRFDGGFWRRFAELGCVYGPEWWKRGSPPVIAAIIFAIARHNRAIVLRNQRQVRGPRGWWRERWDAYRVFAELARPLALTVVGDALFQAALAEGRGVVVPTGHFGSWEAGARALAALGRPVHLVMAHEPNPTVRSFVHRLRTRHGVSAIYSDRSLFAGLPILRALRRGEIVCMQIEPWGRLRGGVAVEFCGRPTRFQLGPFAVARLARAPVVPVFALRTGIRRYEFRVAARFDPTTPAESEAALRATVRAYETLVRAVPAQWLMFDDVWEAAAVAAGEDDYEMVPQAAGLRRR